MLQTFHCLPNGRSMATQHKLLDKHVKFNKKAMEEYKTLLMKMTIDSPNEPKVLANLQLCDVEVSLVLNCLILLFEVVHSFIKFR
jgi:hypothetical protein